MRPTAELADRAFWAVCLALAAVVSAGAFLDMVEVLLSSYLGSVFTRSFTFREAAPETFALLLGVAGAIAGAGCLGLAGKGRSIAAAVVLAASVTGIVHLERRYEAFTTWDDKGVSGCDPRGPIDSAECEGFLYPTIRDYRAELARGPASGPVFEWLHGYRARPRIGWQLALRPLIALALLSLYRLVLVRVRRPWLAALVVALAAVAVFVWALFRVLAEHG